MSCERCGTPTDRERRRCRDCTTEGAVAGVRVTAALAALGGLLTAAVGLGLFASGTLLLIASPLVVGLGLAQVAVARGLWNAEYWAWGWGVTLYVLNAVLALVRGVLGRGATEPVASALIAGVIAAYIYGRHPHFTPGDGPAAAGR
jgi:hypothetical protein